MVSAVLLDIDGTLIDSNESHAHAWVEAFAEQGIHVDFGTVLKKIGMGGDNLMPDVSGISEDTPIGKKISQRRGEIFRAKYLPHLQAFPKTRELIERLIFEGIEPVVATSASKEDLHALLKKAGISDLLEKATDGDEAEHSKPCPDIVQAALEKAGCGPDEAVMLGDTPYDIKAAARAGVKTVAFTSGGWSKEALKEATEVYEGPWDLLSSFHESYLRQHRTATERPPLRARH